MIRRFSNMADSRQKVAVIGSGLIGRSWAMLFAAADYDVQVFDIEPKQLTGALKDIEKQLDHLDKLGLLRGHLTAKQQLENISTTVDIGECVKGAVYIQECVPERKEVKQGVYDMIDKLLLDDAILASSASALLPSILAEKIQHKNRFIVAHPTNPPFYAPLVELVPSPWTDSDVVPKAKAIMERIGQVPVILKKEIDGFVLNRIQYAILKEAWTLIKDDVISVEGLDKVMSAGLGRRYAFIGPVEVAYLNADGLYSYAERYSEMIERVQSTFREAERFSGPHLDKIQQEMSALVPLDKLDERRRWRDKRLAALTQMIKKFEDEERQEMNC